MKDFRGRTAFITGGASGIGLGLATVLGRHGARIAIADIEEPRLDGACRQLRDAGLEAEGFVLDVAKRASVEAAAQEALTRFGKIHIVCNNAGVAVQEPLGAMAPRDWAWTFDVNFMGVVHGMETFMPILIEQGDGGWFVNTSSIAGLVKLPNFSAYAATKYAVVGASAVWRAQLAPHHVGVSVFCPGAVKTAIFDSRRNQQMEYGGDRGGSRGAADDRHSIDTGVDPEVVAEHVVEAIRDGDFYIVTHGEFRPAFEDRYRDVVSSFANAR
jgi:NAD(P)-dependent dehydrogenase (short-subunit alcohol dehydrogenase family)